MGLRVLGDKGKGRFETSRTMYRQAVVRRYRYGRCHACLQERTRQGGNSSYWGSESPISNQGAFERTKIWPAGRMSGASVSVPSVTCT